VQLNSRDASVRAGMHAKIWVTGTAGDRAGRAISYDNQYFFTFRLSCLVFLGVREVQHWLRCGFRLTTSEDVVAIVDGGALGKGQVLEETGRVGEDEP